MLQHPNLTMN
jgi:hypothetical protein